MPSKVLAAFLLCAGLAAAQSPAPKAIDPAKAAVIEEMLDLTQSEQNIKRMLDQYRAAFQKGFENSFSASLKERGVTDQTPYRPDIQKFEDRMFDMMADHLKWERLKPSFMSLYDELFTLDELQGIVQFYKSPTGQALLRKTPVLITRGSQIGQAQMGNLGPEIQKATQEFINDLKNKAGETKK